MADPLPGVPGADLDREIDSRLAGLPADTAPSAQLPVLEELHEVLARRLGEANA